MNLRFFLAFSLLLSSFILKGQNLFTGTLPDSLINNIKEFHIDTSQFSNPESKFFHSTIAKKFESLNTSISSKESIALTTYNLNAIKDLNKLNELCKLTYDLNEEHLYDSAIIVCKQILNICPNNLTALKESSYAYAQIDSSELSNNYFEVFKLTAQAVFEYGNGTYDEPWILNNFYEGFSIYDFYFGASPTKAGYLLTKSDILLGAYYAYSPRVNNIIILYSYMNHMKGFLQTWEIEHEN